ncbi:hypothetical protein HK096_005766 [Nowakowskiella sp. JEL0078]|nr:hypothetical protein HK096_005766 [Nowakowskiella sp. JEL0078]
MQKLQDSRLNHTPKTSPLFSKLFNASAPVQSTIYYLLGLTSFVTYVISGLISKLLTSSSAPLNPDILDDPSEATTIGVHRTLLVNGINLHFVETGKSGTRLILLLHGYPENWFTWRNQLVALADVFHVVAVDMRGYGNSSKPSEAGAYDRDALVGDIVGLVAALKYKSFVLVGNDWGGIVAQFVIFIIDHVIF